MGTKVQFKSYSPGYCFMRNLNEEGDSGSWPVYHEDKTLTGRQYYNNFLPKPAIDGISEHDKEVLKQTMLMHEATFKNQVAELHRVYRVQRNLSEELKMKEVCNHPIPVDASQSVYRPSSPQMTCEDARKMWDISGNPSCSRPSFSGIYNIQSPSDLIKSSSVQGRTVPNGSSRDSRSLDSNSMKIPRLFDLQLSADQNIDNEDVEGFEKEKVFTIEKNMKLSLGCGGNFNCPGDSSNSDSSFRNKQSLADLNHPIQGEEGASSASISNFAGPIACRSDNQVQNVTQQTPSSLGVPMEFVQYTPRGMNNGSHYNFLHMENTSGRLELPSYNLENGQSRGNLNSLSQGFRPHGFPTTSKPLQGEFRSAQLPLFPMDDQRKRGSWRESENFGIELLKRNEGLIKQNSSRSVFVPDIPTTYPAVHHASELGSPSSFSSWRKPPSSMTQSSAALHALNCSNTSAQLSKISEMSIQKNGIIEAHWHPNGQPKSNPSIGSGLSYPNRFLRSQNEVSTQADLNGYPKSSGMSYTNGFSHRTPNESNAPTDLIVHPRPNSSFGSGLPYPNGFLHRFQNESSASAVPSDHPKSNQNFRSGVSYSNGLLETSQSESNVPGDRSPSVRFDYLNSTRDNASTSEYFQNHSTTKYFKGPKCMDVKSAKDLNLNIAIPNGVMEGMVPQQDDLIVDGKRKDKDVVEGLPWLKMKLDSNDGFSKGRGGLNERDFCFLQSPSHQFTSRVGNEKGLTPNFIQESLSTSVACDADNQRIQKNDSLSGKKNLGFPIFDRSQSSMDYSSLGVFPKSHHHPSEVEFPNGGKFGAVGVDLTCNSALVASNLKLSSENMPASKELNKDVSTVKFHFNLNSCADEEEPSTYSIPSETVRTEIDLEAPAVPETLEVIPPEEEPKVVQPKLSSQSPQIELQDSAEELARVVAEAIITISSSGFCYHSEGATNQQSETALNDSISWLADIVSSHTEDRDGKHEFLSKGKDRCDGGESSSSSSSDYFETMTLRLTETKVDEYTCKPWAPEPENEEEACVSSLVTTRRRRGQAKRGRQRRDFQRDILPGLTSLSWLEVSEDIQVLGGLMRATGQPWQTGVSRRYATRNGWARGRKRTRNVHPAVAEPNGFSPPRQQTNSIEQGVEERSLTGWGKTTRRPRRQRLTAGNISIPITQV